MKSSPPETRQSIDFGEIRNEILAEIAMTQEEQRRMQSRMSMLGALLNILDHTFGEEMNNAD